MTDLGMLILTHSGRLWKEGQTSLNYLSWRFSKPGRLDNVPPIQSLPPFKNSWSGAVTFYKVVYDVNAPFQHLGTIKCREKAQHALRLDPYNFLIGFDCHVEHWRFKDTPENLGTVNATHYEVVRNIEHPHIPGLRTIFPISEDLVVIAVTAADAIFILDWKKGQVVRMLRMPQDLYGSNYELGPDVDLRKNYIGNDLQTTHINGAYPVKGTPYVLVSTMAQGAIGRFNLDDGSYKEIARGFVGCHGVRMNTEGLIYFADSCTGCLVFMDQDGRVVRRFSVKSQWLHDVQQVVGSVYAFSLSDHNELQVYDIATGNKAFGRKFPTCRHTGLEGFYGMTPDWVGNSTQFISYAPYTA